MRMPFFIGVMRYGKECAGRRGSSTCWWKKYQQPVIYVPVLTTPYMLHWKMYRRINHWMEFHQETSENSDGKYLHSAHRIDMTWPLDILNEVIKSVSMSLYCQYHPFIELHNYTPRKQRYKVQRSIVSTVKSLPRSTKGEVRSVIHSFICHLQLFVSQSNWLAVARKVIIMREWPLSFDIYELIIWFDIYEFNIWFDIYELDILFDIYELNIWFDIYDHNVSF